MLKSIYQFAIGGILILFSVLCRAEVRIVITEGVNTAKPIAIIPFKWNVAGHAPLKIEEIIAGDLRNSGKFNPVSADKLPEIPDSASTINARKWSEIGVDSVIIGSVQPSGGNNYLINYQLIDTVNSPGTILAENQYQVSKRWLRYAAHTASDEIFETLTGTKGAFRTRIAYIVKTNKDKFSHELRVADYDGYDQVVIHRSTEPLMSPSWSPDGKKLVYVTFEGGHSALVMKTLETGVIETIASFPQHNGAPAFSPDGKKLAFALSKEGSLHLYVMDLSTKKIKQLTYGRSNETEPSWMPDSESLVYTSDQTGRPQLYTIDINNGDSRRLTWQGLQNQDPSVSLDGQFVSMITSTPEGQFINRYDFTSGSYQMLTDTFLDETPSVSPNSTMIIYSSTQGLGTILNLVSADGHFKAKLPATDGQVKFPAWSPYL